MAFMSAFMQSRLPPLPQTFLIFGDESSPTLSTFRRSNSFSGFAPLDFSDASFEHESPAADPLSVTWPDTDDEAWFEARCVASALGPQVQGTNREHMPLLRGLDEPMDKDHASKKVEAKASLHRGVPQCMTQNDLMQELNISGFAQFYNFCYLPQDVGRRQHKGYGFVNFVNTWTAQLFRSAWANRMLATSSGRSQPVDIVPSFVQGLRANMNKWCGPRTHSIRDPGQKPFLSPQASPSADTSMQVMQAQRAGMNALRKARAMMPARIPAVKLDQQTYRR
ncbi:unnamed protein product [Symbiodinium natans]|uniref:Mei2-like C-terminal RNA recognition motif domain-containing protein n=1 Tax=Symbiodinium natans TaxID=878477 RepID=A0A812TFI0_9DINO|nr:unnamed protein product [Symbiodinium natans]